jgi:predicted  nucleic acid-binding Zn-ribbon protein
MISIIVALIIGGLSLLGTIYTSKQQHSITIEEVKNEVSLIKKDIKNLEEKQDKHNSLIERVYDIEATLKVMDTRERVSERRIEDLEKKEGE